MKFLDSFQLGYYLSFFRLRTVLTIPFIIQIVLLVGLTSYLSLRNSQESTEQFIRQLRQELSQRIKDHLTAYLQVPLQTNQVIINSLELGIGDVLQPRSLEPLFIKTIQDFPSIAYLQLGNIEGEFFGYERAGTQLSVEIVDAETGFAMNTYQTDAHGRRTDELIKHSPNYNVFIRPWYVPAAQQQRHAWSEIYSYFGKERADRLAITLGTPFFQDNQFKGVIATDLSLSEINNFLKQRINNSGIAFILEKSSKTLVATSTGEIALVQDQQGKHHKLPILESQHPLTAKTAQFLQQQFADISRINDTYLLDFYDKYEHYYLQVMPYQDVMGLEWLICVVVPESAFTASIYQNIRLMLFSTLLALFVAIFIGSLTAAWLVYPIQRLNQAARAIAKGNWEQEVTSHYRNEIGELAQSFQSMSRQLKDMFEHLEAKVQERTEKLARANEEINTLNEYLCEENQRMGMELEITRKLQQMVLPRPEELRQIKPLDIAGFMDPASEVGGDYYDILQDNGRIKIGIGDVTGHGLESGVLMLMVQTAVRTLLSSQIIDSKDFINILNRTLYDNLQRMQSDKNLTLSLLDYNDGKLSFSGQHEEVLYVSQLGKVARIDTFALGFMVGIEPDIAQFVSQQEVQLAPGEGIVLYTDGLTEAMNAHKQCYGLERLCEVVSQHWSLSAQDIQQAVISDLRCHIGTRKLQDDVTLLVIKQRMSPYPSE